MTHWSWRKCHQQCGLMSVELISSKIREKCQINKDSKSKWDYHTVRRSLFSESTGWGARMYLFEFQIIFLVKNKSSKIWSMNHFNQVVPICIEKGDVKRLLMLVEQCGTSYFATTYFLLLLFIIILNFKIILCTWKM